MKSKKEGTPMEVSLIAGGVAGITSRTVVSPFERVKILLQIQANNKSDVLSGKPTEGKKSIFQLINNMFKNEGVKGLFRGNGMNCIRVFPYLSIQYGTFETYKKYILQNKNLIKNSDGNTNRAEGQLPNVHRIIGGCLAGGTSVLFTYPMDLVKTRLSIQTAMAGKPRNGHSKPPGMVKLLVDTYKHEGGLPALYRGMYATCLGVVPYVALNFQIYEALKFLYINHMGNNKQESFNDLHKLCFGAISGGLGQIIIYPFDLLRRRFQILTMKQAGQDIGFHYTGVADALVQIGRKEGFKGYYKGLAANLFKVVPSTAVQWWTYEFVVNLLK
ncbi:hypothetical protein ACO0RG_004094 [Hanseniaspora osmophila]|uniref:Putative mitochondrial carrier n=1 Tax=Hanseniaspora osmophila TaxID=56408 RepID=A0A1E5RAV5_9ASCO|nr:putative mitochondrial carrier [Hanseniaspora osmophila]